MVCPNCGQEVTQPEANFCQSCGRNLKANELICFYCKKTVDPRNQVHATIRFRIQDENQLKDLDSSWAAGASLKQAPLPTGSPAEPADVGQREGKRKPFARERYFHPICWARHEWQSGIDYGLRWLRGGGIWEGVEIVHDLDE